MRKTNKIEALFWSIALPGFGQLLNGQIIKRIIFIFLEFLINVMSSFNKAIMLSFLGKISEAIQIIDYQWLMFYPCVYMFAMYDAYKFAGDNTSPFSFFPFAFGAYFVTVGLMFSTKLTIFGVLFGPIFLPMLFLIPGLLVGFLFRYIFKEINISH
ncbi:hypothetical protein [Cytobacillus praedii]|uniref:Uncharacterized protein n=1 Tax=Cytobacillus praedii TaxID=1742358 RepID=A0A4R1AQP2_9BACI|nr:hypothetical protein [Cytobacillus praedii]TCJ02298.1 hypothetical protein E0Y62_19865 [Cytobacillus praedii]